MAYRRKRRSRKFGRRKKYRKNSFRKRRGGRSKMYRTGGNFAMPIAGARPELKAVDGPLVNMAINGTALAAAITLAGAGLTWGSQITAAGGGFGLFTGGVANTGDGPILMNGTLRGSDLNQRLGRQITMRSILCRITVHAPANLTFSANSVPAVETRDAQSYTAARLMVVYDRQTNAGPAAPTKAALLAMFPTPANPAASSSVVTQDMVNNLSSRDRFLTIYDKQVVLDNITRDTYSFVIYKKLRLPVTYNDGSTGGIGDIMTGGLFCYLISELPAGLDTVGTGGPPTNTFVAPMPWAWTGVYRMRFTDA